MTDPSNGGTVTIHLDRKKVEVPLVPGETLLESARRAGLDPPFNCEAGNCGTCMAILTEGHATMRINDALEDDEVAEGYILTCQGVPDTDFDHGALRVVTGEAATWPRASSCVES